MAFVWHPCNRGLLESKRRIALPMPGQKWVTRALDNPEIKLIGLDEPEIILDSGHLPGEFHADPADRFLVATARARNAILVTADQRILGYSKPGHVKKPCPIAGHKYRHQKQEII